MDTKRLNTILAFYNAKGGCGKTTTTIDVSAALIRMGYKVLLVDLDGQANATFGTGVHPPEFACSIFDFLVNGLPVQIYVGSSGIHVLPSDTRMFKLDFVLATTTYDKRGDFAALLAQARRDYDVIIVDCPPALGLATVNAIMACDHIIMVCNMSLLAEYSTVSVLDLMIETFGPEIIQKVLGLAWTMNRRTKENQVVEAIFMKRWPQLPFKTQISYTTNLSVSVGTGRDIFYYDPLLKSSSEYLELTREIIERL